MQAERAERGEVRVATLELQPLALLGEYLPLPQDDEPNFPAGKAQIHLDRIKLPDIVRGNDARAELLPLTYQFGPVA